MEFLDGSNDRPKERMNGKVDGLRTSGPTDGGISKSGKASK